MAKLSVVTQTKVVPTPNPKHNVVHVSVMELVKILSDRRRANGNKIGSEFMSFVAIFDMNDTKKMNKTDNPHFGNCWKISETNGDVTFDFSKAMENRGDQASGKGNWSQAVLRDDGSLTPLSVHKADIESIEPMTYKPNARFYLRYQWQSGSSRFVDSDGNEINKDEVYPFIPTKKDRTVLFHTATLNSLVRLTIGGTTYIID